MPKSNPKVLAKINSKFQKISVFDSFGQKRLVVDNLSQSGPEVERLWAKALSRVKKSEIKNVLVLGFGAGSVVSVILKNWPSAKITGVEIDPEVIEVAKKHFRLDESVNVVNIDALKFLKKNDKKFDLILVDLYLGENLPSFLTSSEFVKYLKKAGNNLIIFNFLYFGRHKSASLRTINHFKEIFKVEKIVKSYFLMPSNILLICEI
ncbi:MAG TPA: fused MFS/spermidine synthase [Patescibacteria group bacterium]